jgi:hypothetical protein
VNKSSFHVLAHVQKICPGRICEEKKNCGHILKEIGGRINEQNTCRGASSFSYLMWMLRNIPEASSTGNAHK